MELNLRKLSKLSVGEKERFFLIRHRAQSAFLPLEKSQNIFDELCNSRIHWATWGAACSSFQIKSLSNLPSRCYYKEASDYEREILKSALEILLSDEQKPTRLFEDFL